ncbi:acetyltransferase (GNAT) family protein [Dongia mobilis]|uniref:Acetyltransferase (GNAT) family protein n=1 Tax=Dongia mobilis TaxID=578943 RepID=A0A4R6WQN7_9PROT|nr:GNAT family N-acetyltransferase [Dongia mobilis]TDQ83902.1 acetyltransferase (GNAT) family protein [Dongia mobilis]
MPEGSRHGTARDVVMIAVLRPARLDECGVLDDICFRAKAHWGYDRAFMEAVRKQIRVTPDAIAEGRAWVALGADGKPGGVAQIDRLDAARADLALMFVAPEHMGTGMGRALFKKACEIARGLGASEMLIDSDPQAAGFYAAMGAQRIGAAPTGHAGRLLPRFSMALL